MIYYMKGSWTHKDVEDFEDGKESHRFRIVNNAVQVISRSHADVSGWHTQPQIGKGHAVCAPRKEKNA